MATPRFFVRLWLAVAVALFLCATTSLAEDLVIGTSAAFTGPSRGLGIELYRGAAAYFSEINNAGGIHGRKIALKVYDDGYNPVPAIANTVKLIEKDDVFLLFNYVGTPTVTRALPLLKSHSDQSMFLFFPFTGAEPQRTPPYRDFVFNLRASYNQETAGLVDNFVKIGRKRIAVFYQIDAYGRSGWHGVRQALAKHGLNLAAEATYKRGAAHPESMRQQVEILRAAEPDAVICIGAYAACGAFIRDARDADWDVPIANVSFVGCESMLALLEKDEKTSHRDYTQNLINSQVVPSYSQFDLAAVRDYRLAMEKYRPAAPDIADKEYQPLQFSVVSFEGYLNARLLAEALRRLGPKPQRSRLKETVEGIKDFDLGIGVPVSFGPDRHQGLNTVYYARVLHDGFISLDDWKRWRK
jgi:ABC-type branched-subunit amino acid transport system substrate-binding protein